LAVGVGGVGGQAGFLLQETKEIKAIANSVFFIFSLVLCKHNECISKYQ